MTRQLRRTLAASLLAMVFTATGSLHSRPAAESRPAAPEAPVLLQGFGPDAGEAARAAGGIVLELATERTGSTAIPRRGERSPDLRSTRAPDASRERSRTRALELERIEFSERQRAARAGLLSFGSTAPPPPSHS